MSKQRCRLRAHRIQLTLISNIIPKILRRSFEYELMQRTKEYACVWNPWMESGILVEQGESTKETRGYTDLSKLRFVYSFEFLGPDFVLNDFLWLG